MQLITFLSAATAMVASVAATDRGNAVQLNAECNLDQPHARIINRCDYPVHLWSVEKGLGCPTDGMVTLNKGESYAENYAEPAPGQKTGVSIKISKTQQCKGNDITQLEYFLNKEGDPRYYGNFLDVSYVDCLGGDCPTRNEGYYLIVGNQTGSNKASADNTVCPILSCNDPISCAKLSYILPDDIATKSCDLESSMTYYLCGGEAPTGDYSSSPVTPAKIPEIAASVVDDIKNKVAAITQAPVADAGYLPKVTTQVEIVYVTAYEYVNAKRHIHRHARRHQPFNA